MEIPEVVRIYDSTKVQDYMTCPRAFMFRHVFGWAERIPSHHLTFGTAIHRALEYLSKVGYTPEEIQNAHLIFMSEYRKTETPDMDAENKPKDPGTALSALQAYAHRFGGDAVTEKVLWTETAGSVLIGPDRRIHFRFDLVFEDSRGIIVRDYKTGSRLNRQWQDQWLQKTQIGTYVHAMKCHFGKEEVWGAQIRGIFLYKSQSKDREYGNIDFFDVPIRKNDESMQDWLVHVNYYIDRMEQDLEILDKTKIDDPIMVAFPKNTESCTKYFGCPYLDVCFSRGNPLHLCKTPPMGMDIEYWDPRDVEVETERKVVHV